MRLIFLWVFLVLAGFSWHVDAADVSGTWKFEKEAEYYGSAKSGKPPVNPVIQITGDNLILSERCFFQLNKEDFSHGEVFQMLMKGGESEEKLNAFFKRSFALDLKKTKYIYRINRESCNQLGSVMLFSTDKLVFVKADTFTSYVKSGGDAAQTPVSAGDAADYRFSQMPFNITNFLNLCSTKISYIKKVPQPTNKCAPVFSPYVVTGKDTGALAKLIGSHGYMPANKESDYNNPVAHKLHPVFMVLPPFKDVTLVVVVDLEENESRIALPITYLAIKGGKVTGQTTEYCNFSGDYICSDNDGKKLYQLLETGVFKKLN